MLSFQSQECVNFIKNNNFIDETKIISKIDIDNLLNQIIITEHNNKLYLKDISKSIKPKGQLPSIALTNSIIDIKKLILYDLSDKLKRPDTKIYQNKFLSLDIINYIEQNDLYNYIASDCNYFIDIQTKKKLSKTFSLYLFSVLNLIGNLGNFKNFLNLEIYLTPIEKKLFLINGKITNYNMNSGSCYPTKSVQIWRKEELLKVLIHELIHFYKFDFNPLIDNYDKLITYIYNKFNIKSKINPFEAFTETLAIIIHSHYISNVLNIDYEQIIKNEIMWSCFQAAKLIKIFGGKEYDDLYKIEIKQTSNGLSYYILKCALLCNLSNFINFLDNKLYFSKSIVEFIELLDQSLNSDNFKILINRALLLNTTNKYINETFRMSLYELEF